MAKLTAKRRNALPSSAFGIPSERKYPMPDKAHAAVAKGRATQQEKRGNISASTANRIRSMANKKLHKKESGEKGGFHAESGKHADYVIPGGDACNNAQIKPGTIWAAPDTLEDIKPTPHNDKRALREF